MLRRLLSLSLLVALAVTVVACDTDVTAIDSTDQSVEDDSPGEWDDTPYVAYIDGPFGTMPGADPNARWVSFPSVLRAGVPAAIEVSTAGGTCRRIGDSTVEVRADARQLVVTPHDRVGWTGLCNDALSFLPRPVDVVLPSSGAWTLVVRGRYFHEGQVAQRVVPFVVQ